MIRKTLSALIAATLFLVLLPPAEGQRSSRGMRERALLLARLTVHEAGWDDTGDMEAIYAVLSNGAEREGMRFESFAAEYAPRAVGGEVIAGSPLGRAWAMQLLPNCYTPANWPDVLTVRQPDGSVAVVEHAPWSAFRERCQAVMVRALEVVDGTRTHHCELEPHDWGGRRDRARAERLGLIEVECGETRNNYYRRPSLEGIEDALE